MTSGWQTRRTPRCLYTYYVENAEVQQSITTLCTYYGLVTMATLTMALLTTALLSYQVQHGIAAILALGNLDFGDSPDDQAALLPTSY